jgi:uncharacterized RDD family membrane protein YckC
VNYIIDLLVYNLLVYNVVYPMFTSLMVKISYALGSGGILIVTYQLFFFVLYVSYMFLQETILKGKSIGKFVTGTKAVNEDGTTISTKAALLRSLSRFVPFEPFSGLGSRCFPWHDRWTHTRVIDVKRSVLAPDSGV